MKIIAGALSFRAMHGCSPRKPGVHIERLVKAAGQPRLLRMLGLESLDWSPHMIAVRASRRFLRGTLTAIVDERGPDGGADDFFGGLIRSLYASMPPVEARTTAIDNAITFYVAGHETTAVALAWSAYLFAAQRAPAGRAARRSRRRARGRHWHRRRSLAAAPSVPGGDDAALSTRCPDRPRGAGRRRHVRRVGEEGRAHRLLSLAGPSPSHALGQSRRLRHGALQLEPNRSKSFIASSISRSAPARASASARASRRSRR